MGDRALVVGGTGPTGVPIVNGLLALGYSVSIFHSGAHKASFDGAVEELLGNPRDPDSVSSDLGSRCFEVAVVTSGRLRLLASALAGRVRRLVAITGQPVYRGSMAPTPKGQIMVPVDESAPRQYDASGYTAKVAAGEDLIMDQHRVGDFEAVIVRYPGIYGPRAPLSHEWAVVRRILDARPFMVLPHDGMTYFQRGFSENVAHLVLLAAQVPQAAGLCFNAGDTQVMSARHVAEAICSELGSDMELIGMPAQWCPGVYPLAEKSTLILDLGLARMVLGYEDLVPVEEATRYTARWLLEHPPAKEDLREAATGRFDYKEEDLLVARWRELESKWSKDLLAITAQR